MNVAIDHKLQGSLEMTIWNGITNGEPRYHRVIYPPYGSEVLATMTLRENRITINKTTKISRCPTARSMVTHEGIIRACLIAVRQISCTT